MVVRVQAAMQSLIKVPCFLQSGTHTAMCVSVTKSETVSAQLDCLGCFSTPEPSKSEGGEQKKRGFLMAVFYFCTLDWVFNECNDGKSY